MASSTHPDLTRQLRLALVCDGGVSLAIYMHGVTKELHKLVRASRAFDAAADGDPAVAVNPFRVGTDTEHDYFEELRDLAAAGRPLSVVIDILAGTSAGGVNAVCLAKVLATDGSQDALRDLWMRQGDLKRLLVAPRTGWLWPQAGLAAARVLGGLVTGRPRYPLHGDQMSGWLFDAIAAMDGTAGATLVPPGNSVDLFVTMTDLDGFDVLVPAGGGGPSQHALDHRQVIRFHHERPDDSDFTARDTGALAFAARATSAFPGAFPPVSVDTFTTNELTVEQAQRAEMARSILDRLRWRHSDPGHTAAALCADGGVLDNQPFDLAIEAIARKRAETEVIRRLIYIDPNPGGALAVRVENDPAPPELPGLPAELISALVRARGDQPVLSDLIRLRDLNLRIAEVGDIAERQMADVLNAVHEALPAGKEGLHGLDRDDIAALTADVRAAAQTRLGPSYPTYCRLKLGAAADALADRISVAFSYPPGSNHSTFARTVLLAWCRSRPGWADTTDQTLNDLLNQIDVPYRIRRLQFLLAGVNGLYEPARSAGTATVAQLNGLKTAAWDLLDGLRSASTRSMRALTGQAAGFFDANSLTADRVLEDPREFADKYTEQIGALTRAYGEAMQPTFTQALERMWSAFGEHTEDWDDAQREELLSRYIAFPLWDALIFPTIALAPIPQFSTIGVTRFSPRDAHYLDGVRTGQPRKLQGTAVHHFGGFLKAQYRENDYLWGRLDGAELCLRTLRGSAYGFPSTTEDAYGPHLAGAIAAIIAAEGDLAHVAELREQVSARRAAQPG